MTRTFHHEFSPLTAQPERTAPSPRSGPLGFLRTIRVSGADRLQFLQGQITQDVRLVTPARSALFGWTTARGRLLVTGQILEWRDAFWLTVPAATAESLSRRLHTFVLRARVTVEVSDALVLGLTGDTGARPLRLGSQTLPADALACTAADAWCATRVAGDPHRVLILAERAAADSLPATLTAAVADESTWRLADIRAGIPCIGAGTSEIFIPQMVNLDLIGGVSFSKGCYAGQEIIARTRHLGRVKRRMLRFRCAGIGTLHPGEAIFGPQREAGQVVSAASVPEGCELLAVTQLDDANAPLFGDAGWCHPLQRLDLPYQIPRS